MAGECAMLCNDLRTEVLTMSMCSNAKKTLPRPKVGDFCSIAMEQAFSDACVALCMGETPVSRLAQTCRAAAIEMPRPTIRKWCEHGYTVAFQKTSQDLRTHFIEETPSRISEPVLEPIIESINFRELKEEEPIENEKESEEPAVENLDTSPVLAEKPEEIPQEPEEVLQEPEELLPEPEVIPDEVILPKIIARVPITLDEATVDLNILEGQSPEDAVVVFCRGNMADDVSGCIRQLLPTVLERLE